MAAFGNLFPFLKQRKRRRRRRAQLKRIVVQGHEYYVRPASAHNKHTCRECASRLRTNRRRG